jgi:hypothetical protein
MRRRRALEFTLGPGSARRMLPLPEGVPALFPGVFNRFGRGSPNVATQGVNFKAITGDTVELGDGTSASSPTFASVIALLNDQLLQAGTKPLRFLNTFLCLAAGPVGVLTRRAGRTFGRRATTLLPASQRRTRAAALLLNPVCRFSQYARLPRADLIGFRIRLELRSST